MYQTLPQERTNLYQPGVPTPETGFAYDIKRYKLFFAVLAIATIFHMANKNVFTTGIHYLVLTFAAVYLIMKPLSLFRLLFFLLAQVYMALKMMPTVSNHWIFTTFVNLTILQVLLLQVLRNRRFHIDKASFLRQFTPLLKIELITLYCFVVFHKLNTGFFHPATSCATAFLEAQDTHGLLPGSDTLYLINAIAVVTIEALIPLLLILRKTRNAGLLIGLLFHCIIAYSPLNGFYDFSSLMFAMYVLFMSDAFIYQVSTFTKNMYERRKSLKYWLQHLDYNRMNLVKLALFTLFSIVVLHLLSKLFQDFFRYVLWTGFSLLMIGLFLQSLRLRRLPPSSSQKVQERTRLALYLFPLLVVVNGLCPYLGLKTENSFAMFSNLRTEGGQTNHFFVPASTQVFGYQRDVVQVLRSSDSVLQRTANAGQQLPFQLFRDIVQEEKPEELIYLRNGAYHSFQWSAASRQDALRQPPSYLERKLLRFRPFATTGPQPCVH